MKIGIVGLGLIGGSFAKAYSTAGHDVLALDKNTETFENAVDALAVDDQLTFENAGECDLILICIYPLAAIRFLEEYGPYFGEKPLIIDCCGTKREIVRAGQMLARRFGFTYIGGHPMAGTQFSGFSHSKKDLFQGAPMVIVPPDPNDRALLRRIRRALAPIGFSSITLATAEEHDRIIAFTSQLAHVVSNAYVKSPSAAVHKGFSAGSYRDLTRVAWLNPEMWAELFLENSDYLTVEIDTLIDNLAEYREALKSKDRNKLVELLAAGKKRKEELDEE